MNHQAPKSKAPHRLQPLVAIKALSRLLQDPEQTEEVFVIIRALTGRSVLNAFNRFKQAEIGQAILTEQRNLVSVLEDRDALGGMPQGSLGRAYLNFVEKEAITAAGLIEASNREMDFVDPDFERFANRMRDQHDLWHVLTGYGRDTFGEACLLAFTYAQTQNRGVGFIALAGMFKLTKALGPGVRSAMWQAYRAGKRAAWLPAEDWEARLREPLDTVRSRLNIPAPEQYRAVLAALPVAA
jgi:ubiquinone biosynthesis protein COQ4